jgi:early secretory antigenic target protein ESAT-6
MSYTVLVTFDAIQTAQSDVVSTVNAINQEMDDLKSYLQPIVQTWSGAASEQYNSLQNQWNTAAQDLNAVLAQIGQNLQMAHDNYTATESSNASVWG